MQLTLRARILAAFFVALIGFVAALGYGLVTVRRIGDELGRVQEVWIPLSHQVNELRFSKPEAHEDELEKLPPKARRALSATLKVQLRQFKNQIADAQQDATAKIPRAQGESADQMRDVVGALGAISQPAQEYVELVDRLLAAVDTGDAVTASEIRDRLGYVDTRLQRTIDFAKRSVDDGLSKDVSAARSSRTSLLVFSAITALVTAFGLATAALVSRALAPIGDLIAGVKRISAGDFSRRVAVQGGGEVALLAGEFNQMAETLRSRDERLRALSAYNENVLESVRVGIFVADESGIVTGVNHAAEAILGIARAGIVGKPVAAVAPIAVFLDRIENVRKGGPAVRVGATALANERVVEVSAVPFVEDETQRGVVVVVEDVSERIEVERRLLRSERLAAIGRMSSQITHEVRNPLNSMSLNVEMLEEELAGAGGEAKTLLTAIAAEIERLTEITEGYLGFARLPRPRLERTPTNAVVDGLLKFVREEAESAGVKVESDFTSDVPDVLADENQLRQALLNVVRNAVQAMKPAGGHLRVGTRSAGAGVEMVFSDDGPGISPKDLARIFDPFFSTKTEGTGLGLPLTQQIIEEHGGTIACASEPGRGTTFTIRLPAA